MMNKTKLAFLFLLGCIFSLPAAAKLYKWVDGQGVTHYGEVIPPEFSNNDRSELTPAGREINKREKLTPEQEKAKAEELSKKRVEEEAALEQKRRDKALLNTFSNVGEIEASKVRNLQQIEGMLNSTTMQLKITQKKQQELQLEADAITAAGKKLHPSLRADMKDTQTRLSKLQQDIEKLKADKVSIETHFEADKARYLLLTGGK